MQEARMTEEDDGRIGLRRTHWVDFALGSVLCDDYFQQRPSAPGTAPIADTIQFNLSVPVNGGHLAGEDVFQQFTLNERQSYRRKIVLGIIRSPIVVTQVVRTPLMHSASEFSSFENHIRKRHPCSQGGGQLPSRYQPASEK